MTVLILLTLFAWGVISVSKGKMRLRELEAATTTVALRLGAQRQQVSGVPEIVGSRHGWSFRYQQIYVGARWSQIEVTLPQGYPLMLSLIDHPRDRWGVLLSGDGESHDIEVGDREFDARFLITGAPEPVIRELFTYDIRKKMMRYATADIMIQTTEQGVAKFLFRGWPTDPNQIEQQCEIGLFIVSQLREVQRRRRASRRFVQFQATRGSRKSANSAKLLSH
jgi:hypothetical protein